jgi:hypothetical protein
MAKKKKAPSREERAEQRHELAEFYQYEPFRGRHPVSFADAQIMEKICDVLERTNVDGRIRGLVEKWKVGTADEDLVAEFDELLGNLPENHEAAVEAGYLHGPTGILEEMMGLLGNKEPEPEKVAVIELQGDLLNVASIHRLTKSTGYDTNLRLPSYLILVNKNLKMGDYITSTFTYTYYTEEAREAEWDRIKAALQQFKHVEFI